MLLVFQVIHPLYTILSVSWNVCGHVLSSKSYYRYPTLSGIGIFEQGAGKLDLLKAYQLLNSYTPQVRKGMHGRCRHSDYRTVWLGTYCLMQWRHCLLWLLCTFQTPIPFQIADIAVATDIERFVNEFVRWNDSSICLIIFFTKLIAYKDAWNTGENVALMFL